jgi:hypothetical protein
MTDYNDGQIHGWNGGDCPVHPETKVRTWRRNLGSSICCKAKDTPWLHTYADGDVIAFQVVQQYVEPKVIWVNEYPEEFCYDGLAYFTEQDAKKSACHRATRIAVKYVEAKE